MRATPILLVAVLVAVVALLAAPGCKQQAADQAVQPPAATEDEHAGHEHEAAPEEAQAQATPTPEQQAQAVASETDPSRFYSSDDLVTLAWVAANGEPDQRAKSIRLLSDILLTNETASVRSTAADMLMGSAAKAVDALIQAAVNDPDTAVRMAALGALSGAPRTPKLTATLDKLRQADDAAIRTAAFGTQMGLALNEGEAGMRWIAGQLGVRRDDMSAQVEMNLQQRGAISLSAVIDVLANSPDPNARQGAACVISLVCAGTNPKQQEFAKLSKATHKEEATPTIPPANLEGLRPLERALANDASPEVRAIAAQGLGYLGQASSAPLLAQALHDKYEYVRWWAATALVTVPADAAVTDLCTAAAGDESARVRRAAVNALGWVESSPQVVEALSDATRDESADVRRASATELGRIGDPDSLAALSQLVDDSDEDVRWAAVVAIGELQNPDAAPLLARMVRDANPMVANAAERALQKMGIAMRRYGTRGES